MSPDTRFHVMCERDAGLFSLVQQVVGQLPWAQAEARVPVAYFGRNTCYWTPRGYRGADTVWEYYFEPVVAAYPVAALPAHLVDWIAEHPPDRLAVGTEVAGSFVTSHFGDHKQLKGRTLRIPYLWDDPTPELRAVTAGLMATYVRPRSYLNERVEQFVSERWGTGPVIGVHLRGTDATSPQEQREHRQGSLQLTRYVDVITALLSRWPDARLLVATDAESSLNAMVAAFGDRVMAWDAVRHVSGEAASVGPTGLIMPAYIAGDRDVAARNGEDAVAEFLLLCRCTHLVHNGSGLARTVLLREPLMPHTNTHVRPPAPAPAPRRDEGLLARLVRRIRG